MEKDSIQKLVVQTSIIRLSIKHEAKDLILHDMLASILLDITHNIVL